MSGLELKIPPDVVWIVVAAMMWFAAELTPGLAVVLPFRLPVAGTFAAAGVASWLSLILTAIFAWWMGRFQIRPEERVLSRTFGREYRDYSAEVRRWL